MAILWVLAISALAVVVSGNDSCPAAASIAPCTCDSEGMNCMAAKSLDEIKKSFRAHFPYNAVRAIWIQGTPITNLPADTFGIIKTQQFYIEVNELSTIDLNAFRPSFKSLAVLSLFGNKIKEFPFKDLSSFEVLSTLNLGRNLIETIPDNAFNNRNLYAIILAQNKISHVGMNAFSGLPNLGRLEMAINSIVTLGPMSFAFQRHAQGLQINLSGNQIKEVSATAFTGANPYAVFLSQNQLKSLKNDAFSGLVTRIGQQGGFLEVSANPFSCKGCDYSWLVLNKEVLNSRLIGFTCDDRKSLLDLTKSNIGCP